MAIYGMSNGVDNRLVDITLRSRSAVLRNLVIDNACPVCFRDRRHEIDSASNGMREIGDAMRELTRCAEQMNPTVVRMDEITRQRAALANETAHSRPASISCGNSLGP